MKVVWSVGHQPMFEMDFDERAVFISALETFFNNFPHDQVAYKMLKTARAIDKALVALANVTEERG